VSESRQTASASVSKQKRKFGGRGEFCSQLADWQVRLFTRIRDVYLVNPVVLSESGEKIDQLSDPL
jgi:hypothetical protein